MNNSIIEIFKVAPITAENIKQISSLAKSNDIAPISVKLGNWFVSQTLIGESLFFGVGKEMFAENFFIVSEDSLKKKLRVFIAYPQGVLGMYDAERLTNSNNQNKDVKEINMSYNSLTNAYVLYMVDRYGSRAYGKMMDYGRTRDEILKAFKKACIDGYAKMNDKPTKLYLTDDGRAYLREYYGNDFNSYDE